MTLLLHIKSSDVLVSLEYILKDKRKVKMSGRYFRGIDNLQYKNKPPAKLRFLSVRIIANPQSIVGQCVSTILKILEIYFFSF